MNIDRIKEIREDNDYKQIDIAKILKVTQANIVDMKLAQIQYQLKS